MTSHRINFFGRSSRSYGFTLIESIIVIVIVGVLSAFATPFFTSNPMASRGFHDATWASLSHARRTAIASRHFVCAVITAGSGSSGTLTLTKDLNDPDGLSVVNCTSPVQIPGSTSTCSGGNTICAPSGVSIGGTGAVVFDPNGRVVSYVTPKVVSGSTPSITITGQSAITVQPESGLAQ